ncbi:Polygalacturonase precursor [Dorcoceras hygrometricum]|nr:Polygalacturonase precursor [Dorcoceras hygrometricum]
MYPANSIANTIFLALFFILYNISSAAATILNVMDLGARPDAKTDSTAAFSRAWSSACGSTAPTTIYVPKGRFLLKDLLFTGPCSNNAITIQVDGTLVAPLDYNVFGSAGKWLQFQGVDGVYIRGGTLDGQGAGLWACKMHGNNCPDGATSLGISNSKNVEIVGLRSLNSQMFHIVINGCEKVKVQGVEILAPWNSPNTDGIHVQLSTDVVISNSKISTGDDCVSIGPGATNLLIEEVDCGPGHGISIGSLGKNFDEAGVQNVTVRTVTFKDAQNGLRIKTWGRPSNGDITYQNIQGTSATEVAVKFDCSKMRPCDQIKLQDVNLSYQNHEPKALCSNAAGTTTGRVEPTSCLVYG